MGSFFSRRRKDAGPSHSTNNNASPGNQQGCHAGRAPDQPTRKALLIGIRYEKGRWPKRSKGSMDLGVVPHKEVQAWRNILIQYYGYREDEIICMQDTEHCGRDLWPSKENILAQLDNLVRGVRHNDRRFLFIAGHGGQLACTSDRTELDGRDEILYTLERNKKTWKIIKDNDLRRILADNLPPGANLTAILELCNSGTMMDLPFRLNASESGPPTLTDAQSPTRQHQGNILCLSACEDPQQAHHFRDAASEQGILTTIIRSSLARARQWPHAPRLRVIDLLNVLVETVNDPDIRGNRPQQTPMVTIGRSMSPSELENLVFQP